MVICVVWRDVGFDFGLVSYVEVYGIGICVGDVVEV